MHVQPLYTRAFVFAAVATLMLSLSGFLFVHLPGYLHALGAGEAEIGRIMSAQAIGAIVAWPFVGRAMDARGRRIVILAGCALFLVVVALYQYVGSLGPFVYAVRVLDGIAHTMWYTALFTHAADLVPVKRRTQGLAIFGTSGLVTIGLGAQFGDVILAYADYRALFLGALGFAALGLLFSLPLRDVRIVHDDVAHPSRGIGAVATQSTLLPIWFAAAAFFISLGALFTFMKTFVATREIGTVGGFFTAYAAVAVLLRVFLGWLPDRIGVKRMFGIAMFCEALGFVVLALAQTPVYVLAAGVLCGIGHGYTYPVLFSLVVERAKSRQRGSAMAFYITIDWLGLLLAGPIVGNLIERAGYTAAFAALALLLIAGSALFYVVDRPKPGARAA
ncbi:MAG: MFS transporter [Sulfurifustis sp.]